MNNNDSILAAFVLNLLRDNPEVSAVVFAELLNDAIGVASKTMADEPVVEPVTENWYDQFVSEHTTVVVKTSTVHVTIERGHASEWKQQLRNAGFRWSKKNRAYWAWLDDEKRAEIAERNRANDAATAGMTADEKRAYWAARHANKVA